MTSFGRQLLLGCDLCSESPFSPFQAAMPLATSLPLWLGILSRVKSLFLVRQRDIPTLGMGRMTKCYLQWSACPCQHTQALHELCRFEVAMENIFFSLVGLLPHCSSFFILGMVKSQWAVEQVLAVRELCYTLVWLPADFLKKSFWSEERSAVMGRK